MLATVLLALFPALLIAAGISDLMTMTIPNRISIFLVAAFALTAVAAGLPMQQVLLAIGAGMLVLAVGFALFALGWIGGGDVKLAAATVIWVGWDLTLDYLLVAMVGGGLLTLVLLSMRSLPLPSFALGWGWLARLHDRKTGVPYGIALAGAAILLLPQTMLWQIIM
ncbi:MAG TPA: prepilin peptidase [Microvirga sp.]|jgi:prepilin peptidase CpaA